MVNRVTLLGRLGSDLVLYSTSNGIAYTGARIATDSSWRNAAGELKRATEWHTVIIYGRTAESCAQHIGMGSLVYIEGFLRTRRWNDAAVERFITEVVARNVRFLGFSSRQEARNMN